MVFGSTEQDKVNSPRKSNKTGFLNKKMLNPSVFHVAIILNKQYSLKNVTKFVIVGPIILSL